MLLYFCFWCLLCGFLEQVLWMNGEYDYQYCEVDDFSKVEVDVVVEYFSEGE